MCSIVFERVRKTCAKQFQFVILAVPVAVAFDGAVAAVATAVPRDLREMTESSHQGDEK